MAYCAVTDVQAIEAGRNITFRDYSAGPPVVAATVPSATQVGAFISQISSEIDQTILRAGYLVPYTTNAYLTQANAMGAAWLVEIAMGVQGTAENMNVIKVRETAYRSMLASIADNPRLAGAVPATGKQDNMSRNDGTSNYVNTDAPYQVGRRDW